MNKKCVVSINAIADAAIKEIINIADKNSISRSECLGLFEKTYNRIMDSVSEKILEADYTTSFICETEIDGVYTVSLRDDKSLICRYASPEVIENALKSDDIIKELRENSKLLEIANPSSLEYFDYVYDFEHPDFTDTDASFKDKLKNCI